MNVLLLMTDQQRVDTIGAYGSRVCQTPNLDRLAREGTRYDGCRAPNAFCQPSRASILTGEYASTHGVTFNGIDLPEDAADRSMATHFGDAGYSTAFFGKAHFASTFPFSPTGRLESVEGSSHMPEGWTGPYFGFDYVQLLLFGHNLRMAPMAGNWNWCFGPAPMGLHYGRWLYRDGVERGNELLRLMTPEAAGARWDETQTWRNALPEEAHPTTWVTDRTIDWLREQAGEDKPFFGWVSYADPHHPMDPPGRWFDMYTAEDAAEVLPEVRADEFDGKPAVNQMWAQGNRPGMFSFADPGAARLSPKQLAAMIAAYYGMISQVDENIGRLLDTLDELGLSDDTLVIMTSDHGEYLGDHQLIFKGPLHYESLLRVPLLVRGPGIEASGVVRDPVSSIDIPSTLLAAAGVEVPEHCEGEVLPGFAGGVGREHSYTESDFDLLLQAPMRTLATSRYKLNLHLSGEDVGELYDLVEDPGETRNLWADPALATVKSDLLATLRDEMRPLRRRLAKVGYIG